MSVIEEELNQIPRNIKKTEDKFFISLDGKVNEESETSSKSWNSSDGMTNSILSDEDLKKDYI
jgi:hypothetical protein